MGDYMKLVEETLEESRSTKHTSKKFETKKLADIAFKVFKQKFDGVSIKKQGKYFYIEFMADKGDMRDIFEIENSLDHTIEDTEVEFGDDPYGTYN